MRYSFNESHTNRHIGAVRQRFDFNESAMPSAFCTDTLSAASMPYLSRGGIINTVPASTLSGLGIFSLFASKIYTQKALCP